MGLTWRTVFSNFSEKRHVVKPFKIPDNWVRFRSMDWGSAKPYAVGWYAVDYDGNLLEIS